VILLEKLPVPEPSDVRLPGAMTGAAEVLQHTPLPVTGETPSSVMLPPEEAVEAVIEEMAVVVKTVPPDDDLYCTA
jgi:hypothetical protein